MLESHEIGCHFTSSKPLPPPPGLQVAYMVAILNISFITAIERQEVVQCLDDDKLLGQLVHVKATTVNLDPFNLQGPHGILSPTSIK